MGIDEGGARTMSTTGSTTGCLRQSGTGHKYILNNRKGVTFYSDGLPSRSQTTDLGTMMDSGNCQLDRTGNVIGDKAVGMTVRDFSRSG